jgi:hypothetical protein
MNNKNEINKRGMVLVEQKKCPECGSNHIGKGKFQYEAKVQPVGKTFTSGSDVLVDICSELLANKLAELLASSGCLSTCPPRRLVPSLMIVSTWRVFPA